jgi:NNP family nitrate/nitrite transporter-like MFS transporter
MLTLLYAGAFTLFVCVATLPSLPMVVVLLFAGMMCLGAGNGSVFQLVPQRFGSEIGLVTGIVGAAGGLGGYALPLVLGSLYQSSGTYSTGFLILGGVALACVFLLLIVQGAWKRTWSGQGGTAKIDSLGQAS